MAAFELPPEGGRDRPQREADLPIYLFHRRCRFRGAPLSGVAFGAFLGLFEAVRLALNSDDLGAMHEAIDERNDAPGIGEHLRPGGERLIRCHEGALEFVASVRQLEEQISVPIGVGQVADFIDLC